MTSPMTPQEEAEFKRRRKGRNLALALVLLFCLTIPSNWTQDVPAKYGARHAGLERSLLYPRIETAPGGGASR